MLKEKLHTKNKIINALLEIIRKLGMTKRHTQPVPLINFEIDLTNILKAKPTLNQINNSDKQ